jgi:acetyl-CoA C-acetyltransferase
MDGNLIGGDGIGVEVDGPLLVVTIDREERRNALDPAASHALGRIFDELDRRSDLRVAILTGTGDVAFCAGGDLKAAPVEGDPMPSTGFGGMTHRVGRTKPVIAAVNGSAMGGGFEIALACDVIVAVEHATFALPEPRVGLAAMSGGIPRLIRAVGEKRALGMVLTAGRVDAARGYEMGFVNEVVATGEAVAAARRWADEMLACSPASIRASLTVAELADGRRVEDVLAATWNDGRPGYPGLNDGPDAAEGRRAFAARRPPRWADPA